MVLKGASSTIPAPAAVWQARLRHLENELHVTKAEYEQTAEQYIEIVNELQQKNAALKREMDQRQEVEQLMLQSEKMATLGTLVAGIAHEINNPLGYVIGNLTVLRQYVATLCALHARTTELIAAHAASDAATTERLITALAAGEGEAQSPEVAVDVQSALEETAEGVERIRRIVADLRDFSRAGAHTAALANVNEGIKKTLHVLRNELKYRITVVEALGEVPAIPCDMERLNQVFLNLLLNASQAIAERGVINVKTFCADGWVTVQISDSGCGIKREHLPRIFDPFYTTKPPGKGTGLGLAVSARIVQAHHGTISVESAEGQGTIFTIRLPVQAPEAPREAGP